MECFSEGMAPETIRAEFSTLGLSQVYGAIAFYLNNQTLVDQYRVDQELKFSNTRMAAEPIPEEMRRRLQAAREHLHAITQ